MKDEKTGANIDPWPPTTVRVDPELLYRCRLLAAKNRRNGEEDNTISKVLNKALGEKLSRNGA